jgi:hypothetical protein
MRRIAGAVLTVLAVLAGWQPAASHAAARSHKSTVSLVVADGKYLVFSRGTRDSNQILHARTKHGSQRSLGPEQSRSRSLLFFSLAGSTLTAGTDDIGPHTDPLKVFWWNLAARTSGKLEMTNGADTWLGSMPGAFYFSHESAAGVSTYYRESIPAGHIQPLKRALRGVVAGPTGYVGVNRRTGHLEFQRYGGGALVDLNVPHRYNHGEASCDEMWQYYVRCFEYNGDGDDEYSSTLMIPLNGSMAFDVQTHYGPVVLKRTIVWGKTHLRFRSPNGHVTTSGTQGPVLGEAFHLAIVAAPGDTALEGLSSSGAEPKVLARA